MPIITISRGSYSRGKDVAERVAGKLGYECISREILLEASSKFNVPEIKLIRAIHDAPSILERLNKSKQHFVAYSRAALFAHVRCGNVVYHGLAGHFFLSGVSHVLKVRVIADLEDRVAEEVRRERISPQDAKRLIQLDDGERRKWALSLYGTDTADPHLYDMTVHISTLTVNEAVDLVAAAAAMPSFQPTPKSEAILADRCLEAQVAAVLVDERPDVVDVRVEGGVIMVRVRGTLAGTARTSQDIAHVVRSVAEASDVKDVRVEVVPEG